MATRLQVRRDLTATWTSVNPTLASGEIGFETDTLRIKIGNGVDNWNTLSYATTGSVSGLFNKTVDTLDDINDGTTYGKVTLAQIDDYDAHITHAAVTPLSEIQRLSFVGDAEITKDKTGFYSPTDLTNANIDVSYNGTTRQVTLTGDFVAYYKGEIVEELTDGYVSPAHAIGAGTYFLRYNGTAVIWDSAPWSFTDIMIALAFRDGANFCLRECHGIWDWASHKWAHENGGTYLGAGGDMSDFTLASTTAAQRRPNVSEVRVIDEDLTTIIPALTTKLYTRMQLTLANDATFVLDQADIINLRLVLFKGSFKQLIIYCS
jgi:hypothetical protein